MQADKYRWPTIYTKFVEGAKQAKVRRNIRSGQWGCLIPIGVGAVVCIIACVNNNTPWPLIVFIIIAGLFFRSQNNWSKELIKAWKIDDDRIEGAMRDLYMHEAGRLRDNLLAKYRWKERKRQEEELRRQRQLKFEEEQEWLRKQRETEVGLVKAICLGKIRFAEFVSGVNPGDGHGYEKRVKKFIEHCGFECQLVADSADQGVDLIIHDGAVKAAIQCKYYSGSNAGIDAVQQVHTGARYYSCESSAVLSNNGFTKSAKDVAYKVGVKLVTQEKLVSFLEGLPSGKKKIDRLKMEKVSKSTRAKHMALIRMLVKSGKVKPLEHVATTQELQGRIAGTEQPPEPQKGQA